MRNGNLLLEPAGYLNYTHLTLKATKKEYRSNILKYWVEIDVNSRNILTDYVSWSSFNNHKPFAPTTEISGLYVLTTLSAVIYHLAGCVADLVVKLKLEMRIKSECI